MLDGKLALRIFGERVELPQRGGWDGAHAVRLVVYHLHYFDELASSDAGLRRELQAELIERWLEAHPPAGGAAWEPYVLSLRIVNWVRALLDRSAFSEALRERMNASLAVQVRHLEKRLEWHLLGNHLWANAKALVVAGLYFAGDEGARFLKRGLAILRREMDEQVLEDGGHFERSPMYQGILACDLLDLLAFDRVYPRVLSVGDVERFRTTASMMLSWHRAMTHPDGEIAQFNDAALGVAPKFGALAAFAARLGLDATGGPVRTGLLGPSGYVRLERGPAVLFVDVAPIGPDYLPGHAHADTLSFELSIHGSRLFVNGGTSTYERGAIRDHERSTRAHNTVTLDGENSSDVWASFRVGRRARPFDVRVFEGDGGVVVEGSHDGFRFLRGSPVHKRRITLRETGVEFLDAVPDVGLRAVAHVMLHPDWEPTMKEGSSALRHSTGREVRVSTLGDVTQGVWSSTFHRRAATRILAQRVHTEATFSVSW